MISISPPTKYINGYKSGTIHLNDMFVTYKSSHIIPLHHQIKKNAYICLIIYTNYHKLDPPPNEKKTAEVIYFMNITLISNNNKQVVSGNA